MIEPSQEFVNILEPMRVFKVNECDWVAAKSFDQAKEWYLDLTGVDDEDCWLEREESLDNRMWVELEFLTEEDWKVAHDIQDGQVKKTFRWVMENIYDNQQTPYLIASTEY